jgi:hypothetical protein
MSALAIVLIVLGVIVLMAVLLGFLGASKRDRLRPATGRPTCAPRTPRSRRPPATDRGWERETMEQAARAALTEMRPDWAPRDLLLVLVDDKPGIEEDRAHFVAVSDAGDEARVCWPARAISGLRRRSSSGHP